MLFTETARQQKGVGKMKNIPEGPAPGDKKRKTKTRTSAKTHQKPDVKVAEIPDPKTGLRTGFESGARAASKNVENDNSQTKQKTGAKGASKNVENDNSHAKSKSGLKAAEPAPLRILLASPEVRPWSGTGGLGEVAGSLPRALNKIPDANIDCRVITPLYSAVSQECRDQMTFLGYKYIPVSWRQKYMGVFELRQGDITVYFIDNEEYFKRDGLYGYYDDCERFAFFSRAVFESLEFMDFTPDIFHANDWQTALVPVYQDAIYHLPSVATVFTIHNVEYQGQYGPEVIHDVIGMPDGSEHLLDFNGCCNLMKGGITTANLVSTVSPSYAAELCDPMFGFGMDPVIRDSRNKLRGILNGIDTVSYDPGNDPFIPAHFTADDFSGKYICRTELQKELGLPERDVPVLSLISRLVPAKGIDLVSASMDDILNQNDCQFVALGTGDRDLENFFRGLEERHPDKVRSLIRFDNALSHRIYAGSSIFLMPSRSEPCGLSQMIACRYGTVPVVRSTGGLRDSIKDCTLGNGSGFLFERYDAADFRAAVGNALSRYRNKEDWDALTAHDMKLDFSWANSAREYLNMYNEVKIK